MKILLLGPAWRNDPIKTFLNERGHEVVMTGDPIELEFTLKHGIELILSSGYGPIIKAPVVERFKQKIINLHATYLPYGKGIGTTFFGLFEGAEMGVSLHHIDVGIDTGDILCRKKVEPRSDETLRSYYHRLLEELQAFFFESWESIENGTLKPIPQKVFNQEINYYTRVQSEKYMDLLPLKWDTPITHARALGADFSLTQDFFDTYLDENQESRK